VAKGDVQTIELRLSGVDEMFVLPPTDLFSEYRNYLTGIEFCISVLRARPTGARVRLELSLPPSEIEEGVSERVGGALRRYCTHRITYNERERRATWLGGLSSLWIGIPIAVIGYLLVIYAGALVGPSGNVNLVASTTGWVLVWVGFWFPLDTMLFTPLGYGRENRVLKQLRDAEIAVVPQTHAGRA
jgi:hypothetical protein